MGKCNGRVKFGLKIPNRLRKMSENLEGDFLTHTVGRYVITNENTPTL